MRTLRDIVASGARLRAWCFRCARGELVNAGRVLDLFQRHGWPDDLTEARRRFRCSLCRQSDMVLILPASAVKKAAVPAVQGSASTERASLEARTQVIAGAYHLMREMGRKKDYAPIKFRAKPIVRLSEAELIERALSWQRWDRIIAKRRAMIRIVRRNANPRPPRC